MGASSPELLGPHGPFVATVEGFSVRQEQLRVTHAVEELLGSEGVLLCEAGTGIGKTFAYLVPALQSGRKVVISTATKTLQNQIAYRDLPMVQSVLGTDVDVAVMKGLGNYLCRRRYREFLLSQEALRPQYRAPLELISSWLKGTQTGELSELSTLNESSPIQLHVASSSETRVGPSCPYFDECFVTEMRREAESAQIVIVNHHLFFADLALRGPHPGRILPDYDAVIFDEAHQIEDVATLFFGARLTRAQFERVFAEAGRLFQREQSLPGQSLASSSLLERTLLASRAFFEALSVPPGRRILRPVDLQRDLGTQMKGLIQALQDLAAASTDRARTCTQDVALQEGLDQLARRAENLVEALSETTRDDAGRVTWVEAGDGKVALSSTPVDLSSILRQRLFDAVPAVGLLSATLSTRCDGGESGFSYVRQRLGLTTHDFVRELSVPSPFSYEERCLLYLPRDLPSPSHQDFPAAASDRVLELVEMVRGGVFVLTTSISHMRQLHAKLKQGLSGRLLLLQGERPKEALLSTFRANGAAVLVATSSFWEGVDVPGQALQLVVLDKLPFAVPTDPLYLARSRVLEEANKNAFMHLAVPGAAISLKQGFGRLIRREDDVGIVALLDERVHKKGYGKTILKALPAARQTTDLQEVRDFARKWSLTEST